MIARIAECQILRPNLHGWPGSFGYASGEALGKAVYASVTGYPMTFSRKMFATDLSLVHFAQVVVGFPSSNAFDLLHNPGGNNFVQERD